MTIKMIEIKNRFDGAVIFSGNFDTIGEAVLAAIKEKKTLSSADLSYADLRYVNLRYVNLSCANLSYADLDYSVLSFSCKSLATKFDEKHIIQIIYHAAKPTQNNELDIKDTDLKRLLKSKLFQKVANKFHRIDECGKFTGPKA